MATKISNVLTGEVESAHEESLCISTNQKLPCFTNATLNMCIHVNLSNIASRLMSSKGITSSKFQMMKCRRLDVPKLVTKFNFASLFIILLFSYCLDKLKKYIPALSFTSVDWIVRKIGLCSMQHKIWAYHWRRRSSSESSWYLPKPCCPIRRKSY